MPKLVQPHNVFPGKSKFGKHNVPGLAILNGIELLQVPNETRPKRHQEYTVITNSTMFLDSLLNSPQLLATRQLFLPGKSL